MTSHPYQRLKKSIRVGERSCVLFDITQLDSPNYPLCEIPKTIRVLLECAVRNCDGFKVTATDVENIVQWRDKVRKVEVPYCPARVLMQDFTGVPAVVDLAAMRQCADRLGVDPLRVNPLVPVDLVVDHSVQVDASRTKNAVDVNERIEFERNKERFQFLKWGSQAFEGLRIIPPGNGIVHQVNLEYLARVAFLAPVDDVTDEALLSYPDTLVGTDSHTTMVNGLGCLGWGVGGIEAEAAMLGQPCSLLLPSVVGVELTNELPPGATATDLVLTVTQVLRKHGVVDKLVEFYGEGARKLSLPDRATISNMAPEYGATCGFFPVDDETLAYLRQTGRPAEVVEGIRAVLSALGLFGIDSSETSKVKYSEVVKVDLATIEPCVAGPKRPQDRVLIRNLVEDFASCLGTDSGFKGFGVPADKVKHSAPLVIRGADGAEHTFPNVSHGFVSIAAITSCTNTSNPSVLIAAGLVARKARELGMSVPAYVKTSLSPGSQVVERYLSSSGLLDDLAHHGFTVAGYGCMTCIGNSGELYDGVGEFIKKEGIVSAAVLSGNRNFEARVHPLTVANYLCSPPLVVLFALAGTTNINLLEQPIGRCRSGKDVFFKDLWPTRAEIQAVTTQHVTASVFSSVYESIQKGNARWSDLETSADTRLYAWDPKSTYIHLPPFFQTLERALPALPSMSGCRCLLYLGDSVTTDHISPAGNIAPMSSAAQFLLQAGVAKQDFNTYGARRGNDEIMARGTFANTRLGNRLIQPSGTTGPVTMYLPDEISMSIFDASAKYRSEGTPLILLAGKEYGSGSSRDWAAKGPFMLGVCAVIAESFERIHRSNLVGMGIAPMCFQAGESAVTLGLTGKEVFNIPLREEDLKPLATVTVSACDKSGKVLKTFQVTLRFDTDAEITYYRNGGVLPYVLRSKIL